VRGFRAKGWDLPRGSRHRLRANREWRRLPLSGGDMDVFLRHELAVANLELGMSRAHGNITCTPGVDGNLVCHGGDGG
jgi:hypothetical protein